MLDEPSRIVCPVATDRRARRPGVRWKQPPFTAPHLERRVVVGRVLGKESVTGSAACSHGEHNASHEERPGEPPQPG